MPLMRKCPNPECLSTYLPDPIHIRPKEECPNCKRNAADFAPRGRSNAMAVDEFAPRGRSRAVTTRDVPHLWCPGLDTEMRHAGEGFISSLQLDRRLLAAGEGLLGEFSPEAKLYILAHGHVRMPLFKTGAGEWSAAMLAKMLIEDGLPLDQREIELLVCHAGESVNSIAGAAQLLDIRDRYKAAASAQMPTVPDPYKFAANEKLKSALRTKFDLVSSIHPQPAFFDHAAQLLPMAAQLCQALKTMGCTHLRITSYKGPVDQYTHGGVVYLDLRARGIKERYAVDEEDCPYKAEWR